MVNAWYVKDFWWISWEQFVSMQNLQLSHAEGEDATDGGNYEPSIKGDSSRGLWSIGFHSNWDKAEVEKPLYAELVRCLPDAFINPQVISCEMIWTKAG